MARQQAAAVLPEEDTTQVGGSVDQGVNVFDEGDEDNFVVDFSGVTEAKREVLPKGDYDIVISQCEYQLSASSNKPMWAMILEVEGGDFAGKKIYTNISFSEKALPMAKGIIKVLKPELLDVAFKPKEQDSELLGVHARVRIKHELYNGEKQARVQRWMPASGGNNAFIG